MVKNLCLCKQGLEYTCHFVYDFMWLFHSYKIHICIVFLNQSFIHLSVFQYMCIFCCKYLVQFLFIFRDSVCVQGFCLCSGIFIGLDKSGYQVNSFLIYGQKHMLWVLIRSASVRRF